MNEAAASAIRTSTLRVEGFTDLGFVLWMAHYCAEFILAMCKLTLVAISTRASLSPRATKLSFVKRLLSKFIFNFVLFLLFRVIDRALFFGWNVLLRAL